MRQKHRYARKPDTRSEPIRWSPSVCHAQKEVLRRFDHLRAGGCRQQITIVNGTQPEVFKAIRKIIVDRTVELARVRKNKFSNAAGSYSLTLTKGDRLREGMDVLPAHFFRNGCQQQTGPRVQSTPAPQPSVKQPSAPIPRQVHQWLRRQSADGSAGYPRGIDLGQTRPTGLHCAHNFDDLHGFGRAARFAHLHWRKRLVERQTPNHVRPAGL